ncbi:MAG: hypothetical protein OXC94_09845 [Chloroflexi bacterium]|nr:hypothetical protein [Chloroflexota bacterium]
MTTTRPTLATAGFAARWRDNPRRGRAAAQEHFSDLCHLPGVATRNDPPASPPREGREKGSSRAIRSDR